MIYCDVCMEYYRIVIVLGAQDQFLLGKNVWILSIILYMNLNLLQTCFEVLNLVMSVKKKDIAKCLRIEVVLMLHTVVLCPCWADVK